MEEDARECACTSRKPARVLASPGPDPRLRRIVRPLLKWFQAEARPLPWRRTLDAYAIWVSEIMLQQTQVKTVVPYWERWMRRIPSIKELARARSQTLHKLWEGLGYYRRVRHMQTAARHIMAKHGGDFPVTFEQILALPGIGRYTAGAICSIAFNQPTPILDGNVIRVLTRVFNIGGDPRTREINARLWRIAEELVQYAQELGPITKETTTHYENRFAPRPCSDCNQALMELGATICTHKCPRCSDCPVRNFCLARRRGLVDKLPENGRRRDTVRRQFKALVVQKGARFLARRRPEGVVNGNLWEFPNRETKWRMLRPKLSGASRPPALRQYGKEGPAVAETLDSLFGSTPEASSDGTTFVGPVRGACQPTHLCTVKHSITRYRMVLDVFHVRTTHSLEVQPEDGRWLTLLQMSRLPFCSAHKRILERLRGLQAAQL